jgi:hypothetical protein
MIGADFAPSSLPNALRLRFLAHHLPEFGWEPVVLTTDPKHYENLVDQENERLLPESLEVIRTDALPVKLTRKLGLGDIGIRSLWHHWRALSGLCRERKVDLLFISVPPNVPMVLGRLAHGRFGIPYVIDYQDPWVTEFYWSLPKEKRPPKWAMVYAMARVLEPFSLRRARHIVGVSEGTTDSVFARYPWLKHLSATEIPLGGEPDDFEYLRRNPRANEIFNRADGLFHLSYVGAYTVSMNETVRALFEALRVGLGSKPELFSRLCMHFVGTNYAPDAGGVSPLKEMAGEMGVAEFVEEHPGRVPYLDALQLLLESDALMILGSGEAHYTASKVFPYILARKPLLTIFHEASNLVRILRETESGPVITYNAQSPPETKAGEIALQLERLLLLPQGYHPPTRWEAFEQYTTRAMSERLARAFDKALAESF